MGMTVAASRQEFTIGRNPMVGKPAFSIIIPVYNVSPYLRGCLDSVLAQTFTDWEAICIDDGSIDGSSAILDIYASLDKRIKVYRQSNCGVSFTRNKGLGLAQGDWVTFLDADDMYAPEWLWQAYDLIVATKPDVLRMRATIFREETPCICRDDRFQVINLDHEIMDWGWRSFTKEGWQCLLFQKRINALKYTFPIDVRYSEDSLRALSMLRSFKRVCQSEYPGYFYRNRPGSACKQWFAAGERVCFFRHCMSIVPEQSEMRLYANFIWDNIVVWAIRHKLDGNEKRLHDLFCCLVVDAKVTLTDIKVHWRIPFYLYVHFGVVSPILVVSCLLRVVTCMRQCCHFS